MRHGCSSSVSTPGGLHHPSLPSAPSLSCGDPGKAVRGWGGTAFSVPEGAQPLRRRPVSAPDRRSPGRGYRLRRAKTGGYLSSENTWPPMARKLVVPNPPKAVATLHGGSLTSSSGQERSGGVPSRGLQGCGRLSLHPGGLTCSEHRRPASGQGARPRMGVETAPRLGDTRLRSLRVGQGAIGGDEMSNQQSVAGSTRGTVWIVEGRHAGPATVRDSSEVDRGA